MRSLFLLGAVLGSCTPYPARGVLHEHDVEAQSLRSRDCIEIAFGIRPPIEPTDAALLVTRFGNRCPRPARFDLGAAVLTGYDAKGNARRLQFIDPRSEIEPLHLDVGASGVEKIRLTGAEAPVEICIDVNAIAHGQPVAQVCLRAS